jgi:GH3 auxin-responsive promoter
MAILGTLLKKGIKLRDRLHHEYSSPIDLQKNVLRELLIAAHDTEFGRYYNFKSILSHFLKDQLDFYEAFTSQIPIHDYNKIHKEWWHLSLNGSKNICWPGRIKYFALSSGTSESTSKRIPITKDMTKAIRKISLRQILSLSKYDLPDDFFDGGILMVGGSTHLNKRGSYLEGDLSGIQAARLPFWFQHFYKPGKAISKDRNWDSKLDQIVANARKWNISIIVGVPAWIQILIERLLEYHKVSNIHEIWPNLKVYVHGGVSMDPYRKGFEKLMAHPIFYIETYLASEGFLAYQAYPYKRTMKLVTDNGIFFEFVPFDDKNFPNGEIKPDAKAILIDAVEEGKEYAPLISTCAGAWRYLIGDVIKFTSKENSEIVLTGRTKHFLSLCGEHLSVDNMNKALELVSNEFNISIPEFAVAGIPYENLFAHQWYIGTNDIVDVSKVQKSLDDHLKSLNDDYAVERTSGLKEVIVNILPVNKFYDYLESKGKTGSQNKFPRVLKNDQLSDWTTFLANGKA